MITPELDTKVYEAICAALAEARTKAVAVVNTAMVGVYWETSRQINDAIGERADYGRNLLAFFVETPDSFTSRFQFGTHCVPN